VLIEHFRRTQKSKLGREVRGLDDKTLQMMRTYSWPGKRPRAPERHRALGDRSGQLGRLDQ